MAKQRISLTLDEQLVKQVDRKVDTGSYPNRSHAVEEMLSNQLKQDSITTAVILCGGDKDTNECMIQVNGRPVIEHTIDHLASFGVEQVILAVGDNHADVIDHIGKGDDYGLDIEYLTEDQPLGTAGGLTEMKDMLQDTFIMMNGDVLCEVDIEDMLRSHNRDDVVGTIALTTLDDIANYGVVQLKGSYIIGFTEKPSTEEAPSNLINAGVYILEPAFIEHIPEPAGEPIDVEDVFQEIASERLLKGYVYEGDWHDLGS